MLGIDVATPSSVQLRSHPILSYRGFNLWPPTWVSPSKSTSTPQGEVGVLRKVRCYPDNPLRLFLTMEYSGAEYEGRLLMEYDLLSMVLVSLLETYTGMTIESIGNLEVPFVFENAAQP